MGAVLAESDNHAAHEARRALGANTRFNFIGVVVFLAVLVPFSHGVVWLVGAPQMAVAWAHLIFNLIAATLGFLLQRVIAWSTRIASA